tara:strand:- start:395 stop:1102 length:708 start_codon:yes stop_codon:yes gene_type:complete
MKMKVLVTGSSKGLGAAISEKLALEGYEIYGTSTSGEGSILGVNTWIKADFSTDSGIQSFLKILEELPVFDVLINNAGINIIKPQEEVLSNEYEKIQNINLKAPYQIAQHIAKGMTLNGGGKIINIASIWSVISKTNRTLYSTMKTGIIGMTRSMAIEWAKQNILINAVSPGFVMTKLTDESLSLKEKKELKEQVPLGRFARPEEIASVVSFLCSEENKYLTGQNIIVDGGFTIS